MKTAATPAPTFESVWAMMQEIACTQAGIAVIKQVGDTVVINDKHLKAF